MSKRRDLSALSRFHLGDLQVHPDRMVVVKGGVDIPLEPLWMDILVTLAEEKSEVVSTSQLQLAIWKTDAYGDNPVTKAMSGLRKAIGDDARAPHYIQNLPRRGYRVIAPVSFADDYRRLSNPTDHWSDGNPFVGLAAFDADHAAVFAGRSNATAALLDAIRAQIDNVQRFVLIVGASGCGKTSLLRAGALPMLTSPKGFGGLRSMGVAQCDLAAAPAGDVLLQLASALCDWQLPSGPVFGLQTPESLKARLCETPGDIASMIAEALTRHPQRGLDAEPHAHLLLIIDHAEALTSKTRSPEEQSAFDCAVSALCDASRALVIMVVRNDYYPQLTQALPALTARKAGGHLDLLAPGRGEISDIIRKPAELANLHFEVEESRLDDALRDAAVGQPDALPLLQHTLHALYEQRGTGGALTWEAYRRIGGLEGAIAHHAEQVFSTLPVEAQDSLDAVLTKLVVHNPDSEAVTARRVRRDTLTDAANTLVDAFVASRLFVGTLHDGHPHFSVVHEALLRQWPRAREWVKENRRLLIAKAQFHIAAKRWDDAKRSDDHLLNPGTPLSDAQKVAKRFPDEIDADMLGLLHSSERSRRHRLRIRAVAMATMTLLTIASMALAGIALHARGLAEKRQRESWELNSFMLGELTEELRRREMMEEQRDIASETISNLERRNLNDMSAAELATFARAHRTLGEAWRRENKRSDAHASFVRAHVLANLGLNKEPNNQEALFESGNAAYWIGLLEFDQKRYSGTAPHWEEYRVSSLQLADIDPTESRWAMEVSYADNNLGTLALRQGNPKVAILHFNASKAAKKIAIQLDADNLDYRAELADSMSWIASAQEASGDLGQASAQYDESINDLTELIAKNRTASRWRLRLANILMLSAKLEIGRNNFDKAERNAIDALHILERFVEFFSYNDEWSRDLAKARLILAEITTARSDDDAARGHLSLVLAAVSKLDEDSRNDVSWKWIDARARFALSEIDPTIQSDAAMDDLRTLADSSGSEDIRESLAYALLQHGHAWMREGNGSAALDDFAEAIAAIDKTTWQQHPFRTWVWSEAMLHSGRSDESADKKRWMAKIGYARPCPDRYQIEAKNRSQRH